MNRCRCTGSFERVCAEGGFSESADLEAAIEAFSRAAAREEPLS
jgi:hypothetical protein